MPIFNPPQDEERQRQRERVQRVKDEHERKKRREWELIRPGTPEMVDKRLYISSQNFQELKQRAQDQGRPHQELQEKARLFILARNVLNRVIDQARDLWKLRFHREYGKYPFGKEYEAFDETVTLENVQTWLEDKYLVRLERDHDPEVLFGRTFYKRADVLRAAELLSTMLEDEIQRMEAIDE